MHAHQTFLASAAFASLSKEFVGMPFNLYLPQYPSDLSRKIRLQTKSVDGLNSTIWTRDELTDSPPIYVYPIVDGVNQRPRILISHRRTSLRTQMSTPTTIPEIGIDPRSRRRANRNTTVDDQRAETPRPHRPSHRSNSRRTQPPATSTPSQVSRSSTRSRTGRNDLSSREPERNEQRGRSSNGIREFLGLKREEVVAPVQQPVPVTMPNARVGSVSRGDRRSLYMASEHPRSISQPNTTARLPHSSSPVPIPQSPPHSSSGRRRPSSAQASIDGALIDEQDFRLFAEAIVGLGPEQSFRPSTSSSSPRHRRGELRRSAPTELASPTDQTPFDQTPTTMSALWHLAQMPEATQQQQLARPYVQGLPSVGPGAWTPSPPPTNARTLASQLEDFSFDEEFRDYEDELPDYAESQAQAQAHLRVEAARRAQELQRRWQQSGRRRGY